MTRRYGWILSLVVVLLWSVLASASDGQAGDIGTILKRFPGYHLLTLQERDPDLKAFLVQHFPKSDPSVVHADFDGDGIPDYAVLLRDDKSGATKLVVLLCAADGQCKSVYELDETADSSSIYIRPVPVGSRVSQTDAIPTSGHSPVRLKATGIRLTYFEQAELVLYWNSKLKKIEEVQTGD